PSFAQEPLRLLDQQAPDRAAYNRAVPFRLSGALDVAAAQAALSAIAQRHEVLRATFPLIDGEPRQRIAPAGPIHLPVVDLQSLSQPERERRVRELAQEQAQQPFDLAQGPLWRAALLCLTPAEHVLLLTLHHIIFDGWSKAVLIREFAALYG